MTQSRATVRPLMAAFATLGLAVLPQVSRAQQVADLDWEAPAPRVLNTGARPTSAPPQRQASRATRVFDATPDQVPIDQAGELDFALNFAAVDPAAWRDGRALAGIGTFAFDRQGNPLACDVSLHEDSEPIEGDGATIIAGSSGLWLSPNWDTRAMQDEVCSQFMAGARFRYAAWFSIPLERGLLQRTIRLIRHLDVQQPVSLVRRDAGHMVMLTITPAPAEQLESEGGGDPYTCAADPGRITPADSVAICRALQHDPPSILVPDGNGGQTLRPYRLQGSGPGRLRVYVAGQVEAGGTMVLGNLPLRFAQLGAVWPQFVVPDGRRLDNEDGTFAAQPSIADLPINRRYPFTADVTVVLGIAPDGTVVSCRPAASQTFPQIDNATCAALVASGHFQFARRQRWTGQKFYRQTVFWRQE